MAEIESGSKTLFRQSSAQPGWTKITTYNDYTLRVVSGTASSGGSASFSSCFTNVPVTGTVSPSPSNVTGDTTLSSPQLPSHSHAAYYNPASSGNPYPVGPGLAMMQPSPYAPLSTVTTGSSGSGQGHNHPITFSGLSFGGNDLSLAIKYVDIIIAERDF